MHEFNIIQTYFTWDSHKHDSCVAVSVGDDAAVLDIPNNKQLVTSVDTLISGVHFPKNTDPFAIGHKALAVNLSDMAAMGATPKWFTLALTLPEVDEAWLEQFSAGLKALAQKFDCALVGGDTTRGPLSISIQVMGLVDTDKALLRSGARVGDKLYVTGTLGDAAAGLQYLLEKNKECNNKNNEKNSSLKKESNVFCQNRLNLPTPRLVEMNIIKHFASSCIDVSDGLLQDLSHIVIASNIGAQLNTEKLPLSSALLTILAQEKTIKLALNGGDDYELLFTIPASREASFLGLMKGKGTVTCIGVITQTDDSKIIDENGQQLSSTGYNHFHDK